MDQEVSAPITLRDTLESNFEAAETGNLPAVVESTIPAIPESGRERDDQGRFAKAVRETDNPSPVATKHDIPDPVDHTEKEVPALTRPTTWKKEYLPLWDKLSSGQALTPDESIKFLQYANQRESEYKTGVSTYKGEAENARALQEAIAPFIPDLQRNGIHPAAWINNLGRAHQTLALGNDQQRLDAFVKLANDYNVPLQALLGGQLPDQQVTATMQELAQLRQQVDKVNNWAENQKQAELMSKINEVQSDVEHYPHFDAVRETMAQLLESGMAPDLKTAYAKAIRMQDDIWETEQERLLTAARTESAKVQQVAKAKAAAVSVKSSTPSGITTGQSAKDRRSALLSSFEEHAGGRV
jgi:hypothetical protein